MKARHAEYRIGFVIDSPTAAQAGLEAATNPTVVNLANNFMGPPLSKARLGAVRPSRKTFIHNFD